MTESAKADLERLKDLLDAYGADRTRWPHASRREMSILISSSAEAEALVREAEAFDRLLDTAPATAPDRIAALSDRIMAASRSSPRIVSTAAPPRAARIAPALRRHAGGIAALAASLMIGIFAGQSSSVQPAMSELAALAGIDVAAAPASQRIDDTDASLDGELL